jgi:hypothetical protein
MSTRTLQEDSIYYRLEYARIARLLEGERRPEESRRPGARFEDDRDIEPTIPPLRLSLSAAAKETIEVVIGELTPEQRARGEAGRRRKGEVYLPDRLWIDAARLTARAGDELWRLRWRWVGRKPPWYVRWLGWRHWRRRREYLVLAEFLDRVLEPAAVVLYFSCLIELEIISPDWILQEQPRAPRPLKRPRRHRGIPHDEPFRRAYLLELVSRAQPAPRPEEPEGPRRWRRWLPAFLMNNLRRLHGWLGVVQHHRLEEPHYRVRYNLACLFSRASVTAADEEAFLSAAEAQLRLALDTLRGKRRTALAEWAWQDPGLEALRNSELYGFAAILPPPENRS